MIRSSLRARLIVSFGLLALLTWCVASVLAWDQTRSHINELFDTQQMVFAKRLSVIDPGHLRGEGQLRETKKTVRKFRGEQDDDALAFAIFTRNGDMVLNDGDNGRDFIFNYQHDGFVDALIDDSNDPWRIVWLASADGEHVIAVGQEWEYRDDMAFAIVSTQLLPWLIALPILLVLMIVLIGRALSPLRRIAGRLQARRPDETETLETDNLPSEVLPLLNALNGLFIRTGAMLERERRFTSDAAHELRSPLAALKVQAEVVQLSGDDEHVRLHALKNLTIGIDRASRVVDQLLVLSRLDNRLALDDAETVQWDALLQSTIADIYPYAAQAGVEIALKREGEPAPLRGNSVLLSVMIRNLLDNAIRYGQAGGKTDVVLTVRGFRVEDDGPGVDAEALARIGERFYRPPGQEKTGSGLGLSIVQRIADLHGLQVTFGNRPQGGFRAEVNG
ncbi:quorum sensing histidine kinase QseC [Enterobacillus tribolii]|uniref:Sensor protein QseC n=1 Tax=Enterobacillus tribolii TaxID=1487935 RepID=A0A370R455_9GAMM|nr:quorum sensing histidine kinase QseC [Enterobacillus tribolii]MBW7983148.1 two-component system sensor histidine kinase QseC [Enterobacillus tribolii]RDK97203.1 two-component system sensor histidine kinase QseC [Enterobacillus tribolii]